MKLTKTQTLVYKIGIGLYVLTVVGMLAGAITALILLLLK